MCQESPRTRFTVPNVQNLYDPQWEHDACGIGAVVNISGRRDHAIVAYGKQVLLNLMHRGASGADESTGDGAGILIQIPDEFLRTEADALGFPLPAEGHYGVGMFFLPRGTEIRQRCEQVLAAQAEAEGLSVLGLARRADRQSFAGQSGKDHRARDSAGVFRRLRPQGRRP